MFASSKLMQPRHLNYPYLSNFKDVVQIFPGVDLMRWKNGACSLCPLPGADLAICSTPRHNNARATTSPPLLTLILVLSTIASPPDPTTTVHKNSEQTTASTSQLTSILLEILIQ
jgi:hypothetical protein